VVEYFNGHSEVDGLSLATGTVREEMVKNLEQSFKTYYPVKKSP